MKHTAMRAVGPDAHRVLGSAGLRPALLLRPPSEAGSDSCSATTSLAHRMCVVGVQQCCTPDPQIANANKNLRWLRAGQIFCSGRLLRRASCGANKACHVRKRKERIEPVLAHCGVSDATKNRRCGKLVLRRKCSELRMPACFVTHEVRDDLCHARDLIGAKLWIHGK